MKSTPYAATLSESHCWGNPPSDGTARTSQHTRTGACNIDSLLERMKDNGLDLVSHEQIDTLRRLLEEKESRLYHLTTVFSGAEDIRQPALQPSPRGHRQEYPYTHGHPPEKRHSRFFGKKETVQVPASTTELRQLNRQLITMQEEHDRHIGLYIDSLRLQNLKLNKRLNSFITALDEQVQAAFQNRRKQGLRRQRHFHSSCLRPPSSLPLSC